MIRRPPTSTLFPDTTPFRSELFTALSRVNHPGLRYLDVTTTFTVHARKLSSLVTVFKEGVANITTLRRRGRPARGPRHRDIRCQTRTLAATAVRCHSDAEDA